MTASLPLTLDAPVRRSGEVSFRWFGRIDGEPVAQTVERLRTIVPEIEELCLERIGTYPGGVLVLRSGEVRAPILEPGIADVMGAVNVLLSHTRAVFRFVPVSAGDDVLYAAMGVEEAVELLHGGALTVSCLEDLLEVASW